MMPTVDPSQLSFTELLLVGGLVGVFALEFYWARSSRSWLQMFRPTLFLAGILIYYCLLSPLRSLALGNWIERATNVRSALVWGWGGALVFFLCVLVGFYELPTPRFDRRFMVRLDPERIYRVGRSICWLSLGIAFLINGERLVALLNPFTVRETADQLAGGVALGALESLLGYSINLFIPGVLLLFTAWVVNRRHTPELIVWILITTALFITLAFRWRLVVLFVPMAVLWYLIRRERPNLQVLLVFATLMIMLSGLIGVTRTYSRGVNLEYAREKTPLELFDDGLTEGTTLFFTSSAVMQGVPTRAPFVGIAPLRSALLMPIPRAFFPDKDTIGYLMQSIRPQFGDPVFSVGAAILNFTEYYLIAGWFSLIGMSLLVGWLLRCLWNWFLLRSDEPLAQLIYVLCVCFLYVFVSRGYLAQVLYLFIAALYPLFWFYRRWSTPLR